MKREFHPATYLHAITPLSFSMLTVSLRSRLLRPLLQNTLPMALCPDQYRNGGTEQHEGEDAEADGKPGEKPGVPAGVALVFDGWLVVYCGCHTGREMGGVG
jgi:hypothetical protein